MVEGVQTNRSLKTCFNGQVSLEESDVHCIMFGSGRKWDKQARHVCLEVDVFQCGARSHVLHFSCGVFSLRTRDTKNTWLVRSHLLWPRTNGNEAGSPGHVFESQTWRSNWKESTEPACREASLCLPVSLTFTRNFFYPSSAFHIRRWQFKYENY